MQAWPILVLLLSVVAMAARRGWNGVEQIALVLFVLVCLSWLWTRLSLNGIALRRTVISDRARVGEAVVEQFHFSNLSIVPKLWVELEDYSTLPSHLASRVVSVPGRGRREWRVETVARHRGRFKLGPVVARSGDPVGLFDRERGIPVSHEILVYPMTVDVSAITLPQSRLSGGVTRIRRLAASASTVSGVREYVAGDPTNRIAWGATARHGRMMVKEFDPDPTADVWLVLDLSEDGQFDLRRPDVSAGSAPDHTWLTSTAEYIIAIGASIAERALGEGRKVGLLINREHPVRIDPDNTERQWFRISESLAVATTQGNRSIQEALMQENRRFTSTNGVIVISSDAQGQWAAAARSLIDRQVAVTAVIVDAGGAGDDDVTPLIERLVDLHVQVHRYPTYSAQGSSLRPVGNPLG